LPTSGNRAATKLDSHPRKRHLWPFGRINLTTSLTFLQTKGRPMKALTQYGTMAEKHWREHRPKMVRELEAKNQLHEMLLEAEQKTKDEMAELRTKFIRQGLTPQQAHDRAWEMVREEYILLPPET
jgi:hypothetical protein